MITRSLEKEVEHYKKMARNHQSNHDGLDQEIEIATANESRRGEHGRHEYSR